jgi:hypothetical protein
VQHRRLCQRDSEPDGEERREAASNPRSAHGTNIGRTPHPAYGRGTDATIRVANDALPIVIVASGVRGHRSAAVRLVPA